MRYVRLLGVLTLIAVIFCLVGLENSTESFGTEKENYAEITAEKICKSDIWDKTYLISIRGDKIGGGQAIVILNKKFTLTDSCKEEIAENNHAFFEENSDGTTTVKYKSSKEIITVKVQARDSFIGGSVPIITEGSGIYEGNICKSEYEKISVIVPPAIHINQFMSEIYCGESVPILSDDKYITNLMFDPSRADPSLGTVAYTWLKEDGTEIGSNDELAKIVPTENSVFRLVVTYRDNTGGIYSAEGCYSVNVKLGQIEISQKAEAKDFDFSKKSPQFTFTLTGDNYIRSKTVAFTEENHIDNGVITSSCRFENLPQGEYTLTWETPMGFTNLLFSAEANETTSDKVIIVIGKPNEENTAYDKSKIVFRAIG